MVIFTVAGAAMNWTALSHLLPLVPSASSRIDAGTLAAIVRFSLRKYSRASGCCHSVGSFSAHVSRRGFWPFVSSLAPSPNYMSDNADELIHGSLPLTNERGPGLSYPSWQPLISPRNHYERCRYGHDVLRITSRWGL